MRKSKKSNSGIILIVVLWITVILSLLAIGLSHKMRVDLALTKYAIGKMKSRYVAIAGLTYAIGQIKQDSQGQADDRVDTKYRCGFLLKDNQTPEGVFAKKEVGDGYFTIDYKVADQDNKKETRYGLEDEESKVNLNGLNPGNYEILKNLIEEFGFEQVADIIASSAVDWIDADSEVFNDPFGAEDEEYQNRSVPHACKNKPFDSIEELMLVKGMTPEIFKKIKNYITVFPRQGNLTVNFDTASPVVLKAFARDVVGPQTNATVEDADRLVERIVSYRQGDDGKWGTEDDRVVDNNEMGLSANESSIFQAMTYNRAQVSEHLQVGVSGVDGPSGVATRIRAVVRRKDLAVISWRRD